MSAPERMLRLFLAVDPPPEVVAAISAGLPLWHRLFARKGRRWSWVRPGQVHLTLKFIGSFPESRLGELSAAVSTALRDFPALTLSVGDVGSFPRVVHLSILDPTRNLDALAARIDETLAPLGIAPERRRFVPHLTLGRLKEGAPIARKELEVIRMPPLRPFNVGTVVLYLSTISAEGAEYQALESFTLASGTQGEIA